MPDCQMCWNTWPSLQATPFPSIPPEVEVCKNCATSMKKVVAFVKYQGLNLVTGEVRPGPQAGLETRPDPDVAEKKRATSAQGEEEPPDPPAKKAAKAT